MAQTGFTPIQIYNSSTASAAPTSGNLVAGELAINTADGKLFYLDNLNAVQVIAWKSIPVTVINATGTPSSTTFLRGDGSWATIPAGMVYPAAGIPNSTGSAWGTSYNVTGIGSVVLSDAPSLTGAVTIGGTTDTATLTLGRSTAAQTVNIATGTTAASTTKAINIGNAGNATSTTNIAIGSATGTSTTTLNGAVTLLATTQNTSIGAGQTTGAINIGGTTSATGAITLGRSTSQQTVNIGNITSGSGYFKTVNIGNINSGSASSSVLIGTGENTGITSVEIGNENASSALNVYSPTIFYSSVTLSASLTLPSFTSQTTLGVGNLTSMPVGTRAFVTDNLITPVFNAIVTDGEGSGFATPVFYDGTNWRCG
jgi:hypothetical protein